MVKRAGFLARWETRRGGSRFEGLADPFGEDGAGLGLHGSAVAGAAQAEPALHFLVEIPDRQSGHNAINVVIAGSEVKMEAG